MQSLGIIAEYNPFHNGHLYHLTESKRQAKQNFSVAVMSGNFTQRGDAAIFDKWTRAAMAVKGGVDLVFELPLAFTVRSAQNFAEGGIRLLDALGIVNDISFGSEDADYSLLKNIAAISDESATIDLLKQTMKNGSSYAAALTEIVQALTGVSNISLKRPNNILAIEYLKALTKYQSKINPLIIERKAAGYHDVKIATPIASATAIRQEILHNSPDAAAISKALPPYSAAVVCRALANKNNFPAISYLDTAILASLRRASPAELATLLTVTEGLEHKISAAALSSTSVEELLFNIKSKRYPFSRLQRMIIHLLLHSPKELFRQFDEAGPLYARVLAFNDNGRHMLKEIKKTGAVPVITKITDYLTTSTRVQNNLPLLQQMLAFDTYATDLYTLCFEQKKAGALDFTQSPIYIR